MDLDCKVMRFYRSLLTISYKNHVTNEEVRRNIQTAIGEYDELLTLIKKNGDTVVTILVQCMCVRQCVRPNLSGP